MIRNIIFDLGNVIINYNQKQIINNFTKKENEIEYIYIMKYFMLQNGN